MRKLSPCCITGLRFDVEIPEEDELQITVLGAVVRLPRTTTATTCTMAPTACVGVKGGMATANQQQTNMKCCDVATPSPQQDNTTATAATILESSASAVRAAAAAKTGMVGTPTAAAFSSKGGGQEGPGLVTLAETDANCEC